MGLPARLAFDDFELLLDSGELFRAGSLIAQLQPQPARLLELLASRSGEVVSREEIQQVVWGDSFVDFDASLNFCIKQLRRALGDSATSPRYIETLPRRGYRFLRPARRTPTGEIALEELPVVPAPPSALAAKTGWRLPAGLAVTALALILLIVFLIASRFPPSSRSEIQARKPRLAPSQSASEAYLQGRYLRSQWKLDEAVKRLNEAVLLAPSFAPAFAELALATPDRGVPARQDAPLGQAAAQRALDLDPKLPEAHLAMAEVLFKDRVDLEAAGAQYRQALALDPRNWEILHGYATYLITLGRYDEALDYTRRSVELDPGAVFLSSDYGYFLFLARRYEEAIRQAKITLELVRTTQGATPAPIAEFAKYWSHQVLIFAALKMGDERSALASGLNRIREIGKGDEVAHIRSMREFLHWRYHLISGMNDLFGNNYVVAQTAATSGRREEALSALEHECKTGGEGIMFNFTAVDPLFDALHGDPRFARIVDCIHLPKDAPVLLTLKAEAGTR
jgi:DNA-binding winged helix-turn-helix (wHTH) protein/tetratricopeptide (TPR) repeat protein